MSSFNSRDFALAQTKYKGSCFLLLYIIIPLLGFVLSLIVCYHDRPQRLIHFRYMVPIVQWHANVHLMIFVAGSDETFHNDNISFSVHIHCAYCINISAFLHETLPVSYFITSPWVDICGSKTMNLWKIINLLKKINNDITWHLAIYFCAIQLGMNEGWQQHHKPRNIYRFPHRCYVIDWDPITTTNFEKTQLKITPLYK